MHKGRRIMYVFTTYFHLITQKMYPSSEVPYKDVTREQSVIITVCIYGVFALVVYATVFYSEGTSDTWIRTMSSYSQNNGEKPSIK